MRFTGAAILRVQTIDEAIADYTARTAGGGDGPLNAAELATIYGGRVQQLLDLRAEGYTHAEWKWDADQGVNRWHGVVQ
jgi:hypothetical protein